MQAEATAADEARAMAARDALPALVKLLVERFGVTRIVLFGSLLDGRLHARSDVDLAVAGLPPARYWEALWRTAEIARRDVDLVPIEEASASLKERIRATGEVLYG